MQCLGTIAYMGGLPSVPEPFTWSWTQMLRFNTAYVEGPDKTVHYDRATCSYHPVARNELTARFRGEWLLMLDTDHSFEPDLALRLADRLDKNDLDVVTGFYQYRHPPYAPVLYMFREPKEGPGVRPIAGWNPEFPLVQVDAAGGGCLMVRRRVFDRIRKELGGGPFDVRPPLSEDLSFFRCCKDLDIKVYCDTRIRYRHLTWKPIDLDMFDQGELSKNGRIHEVAGVAG
jgi:hypothetical protein